MESEQPTILIIDRDVDTSEMLSTILARAGYQVASARDVDSAARLVRELRLHLAICDCTEYPYGADGQWPVLELLKALVKPGTPLIVLTTNPRLCS